MINYFNLLDDIAPKYTVNFNGKIIKKGKYVICFQRYTGCIFCNEYINELEKNVDINYHDRIIIIFHSDTDVARSWLSSKNFKFKIAADKTLELYKKYNIAGSIFKMILSSGPWNPIFLRSIFKGNIPGRISGSLITMPVQVLLDTDSQSASLHKSKYLGNNLSPYVIQDFFNGTK